MADPNEYNPGFEPSNPFTLDAKMNGSQAQPTGQTPASNEQLPQQTPTVQQAAQPSTQEEKPMTMGRIAQEASFKKGDYFSHDKKVYHRDSEGNTWLVTGDAMGDVKLDADQVAQLDKDRANVELQNKQRKEELDKLDYTNDGSLGMDARGDISDTVIGAAQGFLMKPKGDNPYEGLNRHQQFGRFVGRLVPGWDASAEAGDAIETITNKLQKGEPVTSTDAWNLVDKEIKLGLDITTLGIPRLLR